MSTQCHRKVTTGLAMMLGLSASLAWASPALAQQRYERVNLVSDIDGVALRTDSNLLNPWGIAFSPTGPFWINDNGKGVSTLYSGDGIPQSLVVTIPPPQNVTGSAAPTGIVFNSSSGFVIPGTGSPSVFLFATEDGTISGWNPIVDRTHAILIVDNSKKGAVYKGLAIGIVKTNKGTEIFIYATNFHDGVIEQYDSNFKLVRQFMDKDLINSTSCSSDPNLPACFAPFGIQNINGLLYRAANYDPYIS